VAPGFSHRGQVKLTACAETLASGFDPRAGFVTVVANSSIPVGTYKLTRKQPSLVFFPLLLNSAAVFGDSGNQSPAFKIEV
jgi:hypothetical protein